MRYPFSTGILFPLLSSLMLASCGGSSSGNSSNDSNNSGSGSTTYTLSGTLSAEAATGVDSDTNDIYATYRSNNTLAAAQAISNLITVQGFASAEATGGLLSGSAALERFATDADPDDFYSVSLQAGQTISLEVTDYSSSGISLYPGDLDLYLLSSTGDEVDYSNTYGQYETITVPEDGEYYIVVNAYKGVSRYVLRLEAASSSSTVASHDDFVSGQMLVGTDSTAAALSQGYRMTNKNGSVATISSIHQTSPTHPALVTISDMVGSARVAMSASNATPRQQWLADLATLKGNAAEKIATLLAIKDMAQETGVTYAEPNFIRKPLLTPNDAYYNKQWDLDTINLPQAWELTTGTPSDGSQVVVAVVDTGVFLSHPDLSGQLLSGYDFVSRTDMSNDGDGIDSNPDDPGDSSQRGLSSWHGTHVAGTIGAASNNSTGVTGIAWGVKILPVRALGLGGGTTYDILQAMYYAAGMDNDSGTVPAQKADIINLSLGAYSSSSAEQAAVTEIYNNGVMIVAAAGNDATSRKTYPAAYNHVIAVSATTYADALASYSNYGTYIDIAAPGGDTTQDLDGDGAGDGILSTLVTDASGTRKATYKYYEGTSMAAPHVAGVLALMKAANPELTPAQADALIANGDLSDDLGSSGWDNAFGYGRINALKAVTAALNLSGGDTELPVVLQSSPSQLTFGSGASSLNFTLSNAGGGTPSITSVSGHADWLTVTASDINSNGFGTYSASVNRTGLNDGSYSDTIDISSDTGSSLQINVSMTIGSSTANGELTRQYVLIYDYTSGDYVDGVMADDNGDYSIDVPDGTYVIYAGSDIDVDGGICSEGETCGAYPTLSLPTGVTVSAASISHLDFNVAVQSASNNSFSQVLSRQAVSSDNRTAVNSSTPAKNLQISQ
jgi:serine protease